MEIVYSYMHASIGAHLVNDKECLDNHESHNEFNQCDVVHPDLVLVIYHPTMIQIAIIANRRSCIPSRLVEHSTRSISRS